MRSERAVAAPARGTFWTAFAVGSLLLAGPVMAQSPAASAVHPGDGKMFIGTYQNIVIIDEATSALEGEINLDSGMPRTMALNANRDKFYVLNTMYETIEVVDIATRRSIDSFTLSDGNRKVRISSYVVDPLERYAILLAKTYDRLPDRFEVSRPLLLKYDLGAREVTDTIAWPEDEASERAQLVFSPAGDLLYFFSDEILVLETDGFTQVDSWAYEEALGDRLGTFDFGFPDQAYEEPGYYTGLFRITDPTQNRRLMGVARVNLAERDIDFSVLGPNESVSFALAPGGRKAYGLHSEVGNYQFWTFDVENARVESRQQFAGRPRMSLMPSSSGEVLYVYNAGNTIDLYEAATYEYLKTIDLNVDSSTPLFILPASDISTTNDAGE
jgi:DNA-binding beta-propeller fold protein YncE